MSTIRVEGLAVALLKVEELLQGAGGSAEGSRFSWNQGGCASRYICTGHRNAALFKSFIFRG